MTTRFLMFGTLLVLAVLTEASTSAAQLYAQTRPRPAAPRSAPAAGSLAWTEPYATALETKSDLVLKGQPLTNTLTRLEFAQWLAQFFGYVPNSGQSIPIRDMDAASPDYLTVQAVLQSGVMRLFEGNQFRPDGNITKLEALAIIVRALQLPAPTQAEVDEWMKLYDDAAEVPTVGRSFVAMAGKAGLILNVPDPKRLTPNLVLRRGEGAALLYQALVARNEMPLLPPPVAQLAPIGAAQTSPLPGPGSATPQLSEIRVQPEAGTVPAGGSVIVEARGTPGGQATVDIGPVRGIPMQEVSPGLYRGTYVASPADALLSPDVRVQLVVANAATQVQRRLPQLIVGNAAPPPVSGIPPTSQNLPLTTFPPPATVPPPGLEQAPPPGSPFPPNPTVLFPRGLSIRIEPARNLQRGDILTVSLWAESGGNAQFDVANLAVNMPMREISPNLYQGTYVVAAADRATNPEIRIRFNKANAPSFQHQEIYPFRIDGSIGNFDPLPANPPGQNALPPRIQSVNTNTVNRILRPGDLLQVNMLGESGGRATFQILNSTPEIPMQEISPGLYEGRVQVPSGMTVTNGSLQVTLDRNGQRSRQISPTPVNISPQ